MASLSRRRSSEIRTWSLKLDCWLRDTEWQRRVAWKFVEALIGGLCWAPLFLLLGLWLLSGSARP